MTDQILRSEGDPMGAAIYDFYKTGKAESLRVFSSQFDEDEITVEQYGQWIDITGIRRGVARVLYRAWRR